MSKSPLLIAATILSTLNEAPTGESPEGFLYAGLMAHVDLSEFQLLTGSMIENGLLERRVGPVLSITEKGRGIAAEVDRLTS